MAYYIIKDFKHNLMKLNKVKEVTLKRHHRLEVKKKKNGQIGRKTPKDQIRKKLVRGLARKMRQGENKLGNN